MLGGETMGRIRVAIHLHTDFSWDSNLAPRRLARLAREQGFDCIAVTDHDDIAGALAARDAGELRVIVGIEVSSRDGHIIGLFVEQPIPPGLSGAETIARIRGQGGLALAPHPFGVLCEGSLMGSVERLLPQFDALEIHNAQNPFWWEDRRAARLAQQHGVRAYVGSDCHLAGAVAPAYQRMPDFSTPQEFLRSLEQAELVRGRFGPWYWARMGARHVWDNLMPFPLPGFARNNRTWHRRGLFPRKAPPAELSPLQE